MVANVIYLTQVRLTRALVKEVSDSLGPIAGDRVLGHLPSNLIDDFAIVAKLEWQIDEFNAILKDRLATLTGQVAREILDENMAALTDQRELKIFETDREAYDYFKALAEFSFKQAKLVFDIRSHFDNFTHRYEIRAGFAVAQLEKKYS